MSQDLGGNPGFQASPGANKLSPPDGFNPGRDFTVADVLAWARTKPADEEYNLIDAGNCALGQFFQETRGLTCAELYANDPYQEIEDTALGKALCFSKTFGGLVQRLEKLCPETPVTQSEWSRLDAYLTDIEQVALESANG
jgi:hypothetical protein